MMLLYTRRSIYPKNIKRHGVPYKTKGKAEKRQIITPTISGYMLTAVHTSTTTEYCCLLYHRTPTPMHLRDKPNHLKHVPKPAYLLSLPLRVVSHRQPHHRTEKAHKTSILTAAKQLQQERPSPQHSQTPQLSAPALSPLGYIEGCLPLRVRPSAARRPASCLRKRLHRRPFCAAGNGSPLPLESPP